jgi:hypothetical protein
MKKCKSYENFLKKYIAGEISAADEKRLLTHIETCRNCREVYQLHHSLVDKKVDVPLPETKAFAKMREQVMRKIRLKRSQVAQPWYLKYLDNLMYYLTKPAFATLLLVVVFMVGFLSRSLFLEKTTQSKDYLLKNIKHTAMNNNNLRDLENSPYIFSNVQFREVDDQNIALSFDVATHVELVSLKDDPLVKEVLAQSLLNPEPLGIRLKTLTFAQEIMDPKIKEALIFTLKDDPDLAVRMRAMTSLMVYPDDQQIQEAFLQVLKEEQSVNMRLMAIDYLAQTNVNTQALQNTMPYLKSDRDAAVRHKLNQYLDIKRKDEVK